MIPELEKIDFFLKVKGELLPGHFDAILSEINSIHNIQSTFEVNPESLKSKHNLLFDEF